MKTKLLVLALLLSMSSVASAKVNWQGEVMVTALSGAGCAADAHLVGDNFLSAYLPQGLSNNGNTSYLSFVSRRSAWSMKFTSTANNAAYTWTRITGRGEWKNGAGTILTLTRTPSSVTTATQTLVINAQVSNWIGTANCTATIQGAFVQRVGP
jgi:hypothetical protein